MLTQIVRPLVNPQVRLLAKSKATRSTLIKTIVKWLGFLGVEANVTQIERAGDKIQVSITVGKPETSDRDDWQEILNGLQSNRQQDRQEAGDTNFGVIPPEQETKYQRILAYAIQMSYAGSNCKWDWDSLYPQLKLLGLEDSMLIGISDRL